MSKDNLRNILLFCKI